MLPVGKLPPQLLAKLLSTIPADPRVILGPHPGEDAAVLDLPDRYLVAKTDPITFATDEIGWYAVQINANDIATTGAVPLWFMATVLLPSATATAHLVQTIFNQITSACRALNIALIGGHTEITHDLNRPIVVGCMLGEVSKDRMVRTGGALPGDHIYLTKGAPIEATAIMAREKRDLLSAQFDSGMLNHCAGFLHAPGISVVNDARLAMKAGGITSMHDPTEGGLVSALWEVAEASLTRLEVDLYGKNHPWLPEAELLCRALNLDPACAIASGALLLTIKPECAARLEELFKQANISLFHLGNVASGPPDVWDQQRGRLIRPSRDEIARLFD